MKNGSSRNPPTVADLKSAIRAEDETYDGLIAKHTLEFEVMIQNPDSQSALEQIEATQRALLKSVRMTQWLKGQLAELNNELIRGVVGK